jgi:hypothetical protein
MIQYLQDHYQDFLVILTGIVTVASVIVKLTPTLKDDTILAKVMAVVEKLALNKK